MGEWNKVSSRVYVERKRKFFNKKAQMAIIEVGSFVWWLGLVSACVCVFVHHLCYQKKSSMVYRGIIIL